MIIFRHKKTPYGAQPIGVELNSYKTTITTNAKPQRDILQVLKGVIKWMRNLNQC